MHEQVDARRFASLQRLYGVQGAGQIAASHVLVIGIGGVGSWASECLARSGVGRITLVDMDHVAESNINRQIHAQDSTLGMAKVEAMRQRITSFHPQCVVQCVDDFVTPENWLGILRQAEAVQPVTAVLDCCDQVKTKTALASWAQQRSVRAHGQFVTVGAAGGKRRPELVEVADLSQVTHDPVLAQVRYQLRRAQRAVAAPDAAAVTGVRKNSKTAVEKFHIHCVFSREPVARPHESCGIDGTVAPGAGGQALNCAGYGSAVTVTAVFGMVAAGAVLNSLGA